MKRIFGVLILLALPALLAAQSHHPQHGTIIRMRMTQCLGPQHGFMAAMSGGGAALPEQAAPCPEYVLETDQVVYVISGKSSEALLPLAEVTRFRLLKNEMLIRIDDANKESHFRIKTMVLRPDWDHEQRLEEAEAAHRIDSTMNTTEH